MAALLLSIILLRNKKRMDRKQIQFKKYLIGYRYTSWQNRDTGR